MAFWWRFLKGLNRRKQKRTRKNCKSWDLSQAKPQTKFIVSEKSILNTCKGLVKSWIFVICPNDEMLLSKSFSIVFFIFFVIKLRWWMSTGLAFLLHWNFCSLRVWAFAVRGGWEEKILSRKNWKWWVSSTLVKWNGFVILLWLCRFKMTIICFNNWNEMKMILFSFMVSPIGMFSRRFSSFSSFFAFSNDFDQYDFIV